MEAAPTVISGPAGLGVSSRERLPCPTCAPPERAQPPSPAGSLPDPSRSTWRVTKQLRRPLGLAGNRICGGAGGEGGEGRQREGDDGGYGLRRGAGQEGLHLPPRGAPGIPPKPRHRHRDVARNRSSRAGQDHARLLRAAPALPRCPPQEFFEIPVKPLE